MSSGSFFRTAVTRERLYRRRSRRTSECSVAVSSPAVAWRLALAASRRRSVGSESPTVPAAKAGRRTAALRLQGLEIEREGLAGAGGIGSRPWRPLNAAKSALSWRRRPARSLARAPASRGRARPPGKLREDGSPALERLDRGQRVPASAVFAERADLGAVSERFDVHFFRREIVASLVPENGCIIRHDAL